MRVEPDIITLRHVGFFKKCNIIKVKRSIFFMIMFILLVSVRVNNVSKENSTTTSYLRNKLFIRIIYDAADFLFQLKVIFSFWTKFYYVFLLIWQFFFYFENGRFFGRFSLSVYARVGKVNLVLRNSVPHFPPNSGGITC